MSSYMLLIEISKPGTYIGGLGVLPRSKVGGGQRTQRKITSIHIDDLVPTQWEHPQTLSLCHL